MKENAEPYLYHMVPKSVSGDTLHPLNTLKTKEPELYKSLIEKYAGREEVMQTPIPPLGEECTWSDVIHLSAIHPAELKRALIDAGMDPEEPDLQTMKFYQIDPHLLDPEQTIIYLHQETTPRQFTESFNAYDPNKLAEHAVLPEATKDHYKNKIRNGEKPLYFLGVPHILHKGSLDISKLPIIEV